MGDKGAQFICQALLKNNSLEKLDVSFNEMGSQGIEFVSRALLKNTSLQILKLRGNEIYFFKDYDCIRESLKKNPSLKDIDGIELVEYVENKITLGKWRHKIQNRRNKIQKILGVFIQELHITRSILLMESNLPLPLLY